MEIEYSLRSRAFRRAISKALASREPFSVVVRGWKARSIRKRSTFFDWINGSIDNPAPGLSFARAWFGYTLWATFVANRLVSLAYEVRNSSAQFRLRVADACTYFDVWFPETAPEAPGSEAPH